jgi:hypothetical protein
MTPSASARSPTDSVPVDATVRLAQNFINGLKLNLIDFGGGLRSSLGCGRQFSKPSELGTVVYLNFSDGFVKCVPNRGIKRKVKPVFKCFVCSLL